MHPSLFPVRPVISDVVNFGSSSFDKHMSDSTDYILNPCYTVICLFFSAFDVVVWLLERALVWCKKSCSNGQTNLTCSSSRIIGQFVEFRFQFIVRVKIQLCSISRLSVSRFVDDG